jgi:hypothetical protein
MSDFVSPPSNLSRGNRQMMRRHAKASEPTPELIEQVLRSVPWRTSTHRVLLLLRRWIITLFGIPAVIVVSTHFLAALILIPLLLIADLRVHKKAADFSMPETRVLRAAAMHRPNPFLPDPAAARQIVRAAIVLTSVYVAASICAAIALGLFDSEAIRRTTGAVFASLMALLGILSVAFASLYTAPLLAIVNKGSIGIPSDSNTLVVAELAGGVHWSLGIIGIVPKNIRTALLILPAVAGGLLVNRPCGPAIASSRQAKRERFTDDGCVFRADLGDGGADDLAALVICH